MSMRIPKLDPVEKPSIVIGMVAPIIVETPNPILPLDGRFWENWGVFFVVLVVFADFDFLILDLLEVLLLGLLDENVDFVPIGVEFSKNAFKKSSYSLAISMSFWSISSFWSSNSSSPKSKYSTDVPF